MLEFNHFDNNYSCSSRVRRLTALQNRARLLRAHIDVLLHMHAKVADRIEREDFSRPVRARTTAEQVRLLLRGQRGRGAVHAFSINIGRDPQFLEC